MSDATSTLPADLVNVQIDGVWRAFPKGTRLIEACAQSGAEVPHYCYHPKLTSPGNCRMCLVETGMPPRPAPGQEPELDADGRAKISWSPRPMIACANTVAEGMGVRTSSQLVHECRNGVMEFLLANHPLDCPICDQAGECTLQEYSVEHGRGESRFHEAKVKKPKNVDIGPRVRLDDERCVMCSRCIRFCAEIVDDPVLGFTDRGSHTTLTVHPDKRLENNYSLNTVDICPVGALTSNDFRFQMRVWFMKEAESICTKCARGCNTVIATREGKIFRQSPRENNEVNSTWMCDQGRLDFHHVNSEYRLTQPLVKTGRGHRPASWEEAYRLVVSALDGAPAARIAIVASARMTNEELYLARLLAEKLGARVAIVPRVGGGDDYLRTDDLNPNSLGAAQILGPDAALRLAEIRRDVEDGSVSYLFAFGENLLKAGFQPESLGKLSLLVSTHILANITAELSHAVLPGVASLEKDGTMINVSGRLQRLNAVVQPPGEARSEWRILRNLLGELGGKAPDSVDAILEEAGKTVHCFQGHTHKTVPQEGVVVIETGEVAPLLKREREKIASGTIVG